MCKKIYVAIVYLRFIQKIAKLFSLEEQVKSTEVTQVKLKLRKCMTLVSISLMHRPLSRTETWVTIPVGTEIVAAACVGGFYYDEILVSVGAQRVKDI